VTVIDLQLARPGGYSRELRLGKRREERDRRKPSSIHVRTLLGVRLEQAPECLHPADFR
jgi:hypothetical protein